MTWMIIIAILLILFCIIIVTKVKVQTMYRHRKDDDLLEVKVYVWWIRVYTFSAPVIKLDDDSFSLEVEEEQQIGPTESKKKGRITPQIVVEKLRLLRDFLDHVVGLHKIIKRFLKKVKVHNFEWHSGIGVADAAYTAQLTGVVWSLKGAIVGVLSKYMRLQQMPKLSVEPHFQMMITHTNLSCMISFRIGQAMIAGLMLLKHWRRRPKFKQSHSVEENM